MRQHLFRFALITAIVVSTGACGGPPAGGSALTPDVISDGTNTDGAGTDTDTNHVDTEPNDSFSTAQSISADVTYTGQKNSSESDDYFKLTATGSSMTVSLSHVTPNASGSDFYVDIYNSSQTKIAYYSAENGLDNSMTTGVISGQVYYIKVYVNYGGEYQYKLKVSFGSLSYEQEPNDEFSTAQTISAGVEYTGQNNGSEQNDYFKVVATGSSMTVSLSHVTPNASGSDFYVDIYDSSQTRIAYIPAENGLDNSMTTGVTSGQTYYVKVYVNYGGSYQYKLTVSFGSAAYELEPNDDFSKAQSISANVEYAGQNNGSELNDYFKITASGSSMTVSLSHGTPNASGSDFYVDIYNSSQTKIAHYAAENGLDNGMVSGVISGQTYYIKVYVNYGGDYQYTLKVSFGNLPYEQEPNDDFSTAQSISAGVDYTGQNNGSELNDYFKITASGSSMTVSLSHVTPNEAASDFSVNIYNASQTQLAYFAADNGLDNNATTGVTSGQVYYIKVYVNYGGYYQYKLRVDFTY